MPLNLTTIPVPGTAATARVYADPDRATEHLCNHVLVEPECFAWGAVLPEWAAILGDERASAERHNEAARGRQTDGESLQPLYDAYAAALRDEGLDAQNRRWFVAWNPPAHARAGVPVVVGFGTRAVLMVFENWVGRWVLTTAFVPGQGDPTEIRAARAANRPRENRPTRAERLHHRDRTRMATREAVWSADEWYYYRVFRPAIRFLRGLHTRARDADGTPLERHYGLITECLPKDIVAHGPEQWVRFRRDSQRPEVGR